MIVRLTPEQVSNNWKPIRRAVELSLPPLSYGAENRMERILEALLNKEMDCWLSYDKYDRLDCILTTSMTHDDISGVKSLLIFSIFGLDAGRLSWLEGFKTLVKYAKSRGCDRLIGYTTVDSVVSFVERLGGNADFRLIDIPLGGKK